MFPGVLLVRRVPRYSAITVLTSLSTLLRPERFLRPGLLLLALLLVAACQSGADIGDATQEDDAAVADAEAADGDDSDDLVSVRVVVADKTDKRPLGEMAEIWIDGAGSWILDTSNGGMDGNFLDGRQVGEELGLLFYPDGRENGAEIKIPVMITAEMCPDACVDDMVAIEVFDDRVDVKSTAIKDGSATYKR